MQTSTETKPLEPARAFAVLELVFAASFWGFGFIAAIWALGAMGPLAITGWRFALASLTGLLICLATPGLRRHLTRKSFFLAAIPGFCLSLTLVLQTWGLRTTTATKSGFITCLYVLIVPLLEQAFFKRKIHRLHFLFVLIALGGTALICGFQPHTLVAGDWNFGDFLTLLCAVAASFHILVLGVVSTRAESSFVFNLCQSIWAGALPLALSFIFEPAIKWPVTGKPLIGLLALAYGSTLIAFSLQIRAQKKISPSIASLLFLLESPFATLYAIYFLGESLTTLQWAGAGLIMIAVIASTFASSELMTSEREVNGNP
jgi:drug/metabolite transporter (DMT)-like permease